MIFVVKQFEQPEQSIDYKMYISFHSSFIRNNLFPIYFEGNGLKTFEIESVTQFKSIKE